MNKTLLTLCFLTACCNVVCSEPETITEKRTSTYEDAMDKWEKEWEAYEERTERDEKIMERLENILDRWEKIIEGIEKKTD